MSRSPLDWDAETYERVSAPQVAWATEVLDRLDPAGVERALDAGCGTGRVTELLVDRLPDGAEVVALDGSPAMVREARERLGSRVTVLEQDLLELDLPAPVDLVFSNATFHWIADHDALFARLHAALRPGGRVHAQCGGAGNLARYLAHVDALMEREPYREHLAGWRKTWHFAGAEETEAALRRAGFTEARAWLSEAPTDPPEPRAFLAVVVLRTHLERLPDHLRERFLDDALDGAPEPLLDYVRLNIEARRS